MLKDNGSAKSDDQTANNVSFQESSKSHEETVSESAKREKNRLLTIQELIQTESDYLIELSLCCDVFMTANDDQHSVRLFRLNFITFLKLTFLLIEFECQFLEQS